MPMGTLLLLENSYFAILYCRTLEKNLVLYVGNKDANLN